MHTLTYYILDVQSGIIGNVTTSIKTDIIATAESLDIRPATLITFLRYLLTHSNTTRQDIIVAIGLPFNHLTRILIAFQDYFEPRRDIVSLTPTARAMIEKYLVDNNDSHLLVNRQIRLRNMLDKYQGQRPSADRMLDQFTATLDTTIRRAVELNKAEDLFGRDIAFLGDDDLTSIAAGIIDTPRRIQVLDIDQRILNHIAMVTKQEALPIETEHYDARQQLPHHLRHSFDVVFTDPPYTPDGITLFLARAVELVRPRVASRIYLCYGTSERARERELTIQKIILDFGLIIHQKLAYFNQYQGADSIGSNSSLYALDLTPKTSVPKATYKRIYTHE